MLPLITSFKKLKQIFSRFMKTLIWQITRRNFRSGFEKLSKSTMKSTTKSANLEFILSGATGWFNYFYPNWTPFCQLLPDMNDTSVTRFWKVVEKTQRKVFFSFRNQTDKKTDQNLIANWIRNNHLNSTDKSISSFYCIG